MSPEKFWAVWRIDGGSPPHKRHTTLAAAQAEAERLAKLADTPYYVLETVGVVERPKVPMEWREL